MENNNTKKQNNKNYISMQCGTGKTIMSILSIYKELKPKNNK